MMSSRVGSVAGTANFPEGPPLAAAPAALSIAPPTARLRLVPPPRETPRADDAISTSRELTGLSRRSRRQVRRTLREVSSIVDTMRARRTVPAQIEAGGHQAGVAFDVWRLHVAYERSRSAEDLDALVAEYEPYALSLARRLRGRHDSADDLDQVAREALIVSLQRFDVSRGIPFPALATPTILGALRRHHRDHGWAMRVPRRVHELAAPTREASERLTAKLGRPARPAEVAASLGIATGELEAIQQALHARDTASLDTAVDAESRGHHDVIGEIDRNLVRAEQHLALRQALAQLDDRDRAILHLYFYEELTQSRIAERFGVSQMQISRWIARSLARLRSHLEV